MEDFLFQTVSGSRKRSRFRTFPDGAGNVAPRLTSLLRRVHSRLFRGHVFDCTCATLQTWLWLKLAGVLSVYCVPGGVCEAVPTLEAHRGDPLICGGVLPRRRKRHPWFGHG